MFKSIMYNIIHFANLDLFMNSLFEVLLRTAFLLLIECFFNKIYFPADYSILLYLISGKPNQPDVYEFLLPVLRKEISLQRKLNGINIRRAI